MWVSDVIFFRGIKVVVILTAESLVLGFGKVLPENNEEG